MRYYYEALDRDVFYVAEVENEDDEITCKVYEISIIANKLLSIMTFAEFSQKAYFLECEKLSKETIFALEEIIGNKLFARRFVSTKITPDEVILLDFLKSVSDYKDIPTESGKIITMSNVALSYLFPNAHTTKRQTLAVNKDIPVTSQNIWKYRANMYCESRGFALSGVEWKALYFISACQYHCGAYRSPLYSVDESKLFT